MVFLQKVTGLVLLFDRKLQTFKNSPKWTIFCILSTQNVNVARFARNVECDFFVIFKHCDTRKTGVLNLVQLYPFNPVPHDIE